MTEERKEKTTPEKKEENRPEPGTTGNPPGASASQNSGPTTGKPGGQRGDPRQQPRPPYRPPSTDRERQAGQSGGQGPARPQGQSFPQNQRPPADPAQARRPQNRPPQHPGETQQGAPAPHKAGQPQNRQIDWLRSKPMPAGSRPPAAQRGLDLGRPDAWSGRQKPPPSATPGAPPPSADRRPPAAGPARPQEGGQPYRSPRPNGAPYGQRPPGTGYPSGPRPSGPRPGGVRPGGFGTPRPGGTAATWGKGTETSRRARSARKTNKDREKPILEEDAEARGRSRGETPAYGKTSPGSGRTPLARPLLKAKLEPAAPEVGKAIAVPARVTVKELADILGISSVEIIKELMKNGIMAPINQTIDFDTASIVASDLGFEIRPADLPEAAEVAPVAVAPEPVLHKPAIVEDDPSKLVPRPPVVTIMGHVDHGKTSLLDAIRRTNVAAGEFGGITQHIGAYQVEEKNQKITFLDTPGHEAFTAMRARGAQVTDVAVVVVAADDGVQPQTLEAINHARAAGVPIVVALNKIDRETANPERVKQQLADAGLVPEEWGGNAIVVPVSAKKGTGVSDLLDMILLVAEMASLKANPNRPAIGTIIEAEMDKTKGPMATVLVQHGTLNVGDHVVVGSIYGKIRAMFNDKGKDLRKATPSTPVSILGLSDVPQSGDMLEAMPSERAARELADQRRERQQREAAVVAPPTMDLEHLSDLIAAGAVKELNVVLKVDVQGSLEPIVNSLKKLGDEKEKVQVRLLHAATGMITESDVTLAAAARSASANEAATVIGFNVEADAAAKRTAEMLGIEIRCFKVIYDLVDAIEKALKGLYEPKYQEVIDGHAEVRQVFKLSKGMTIAGSIVNDGIITRGAPVRVRRNDTVVFDGKVASLRRFKDDVKEVTAGFECGVTLEGYNDILEKDIIEAYHKERMN